MSRSSPATTTAARRRAPMPSGRGASVVFGARDPNPRVRGGGAARLRRRGIAVESGVEAEACAELIAGFSSLMTRGRPLVTLKLAASLDGRIATRTGASRWITSPPARALVHRLRNEYDAVMVGAGTVLGRPELTCRRRGGRDPLRVIVDGRLRTPLTARVVSDAAALGTVSYHRPQRPQVGRAARSRRSRPDPARRAGEISLPARLRRLAADGGQLGAHRGRRRMAATAGARRVVDQALFFFAPS